MIQRTLERLRQGATLSESEAEAVFEQILTGQLDDAQIGAFLAMIAARGPTVDELVGGAHVMRRFVTPVPAPAVQPGVEAPPLIDTCGTGGAPKMFNVSTAAAIVTAAAAPGRVMVAKHGSRSRTGRGSSEVLAKVGVNVDASPEVQSRCLAEIGVCFCFAIHHHPAMKHAAGPRKSLGFPTIFNLLGPLTNPAGAPRQLIGTYNADLARKITETLARLGAVRAVVVTTHDGLDELTTTNTNLLHLLDGGEIRTRILDPGSLGLARARQEDLRVEDIDSAAGLLKGVIEGSVSGPALEVLLLNVAAALVVADAATDLREGIEMGREAISSGEAGRTLAALARLSHESAP